MAGCLAVVVEEGQLGFVGPWQVSWMMLPTKFEKGRLWLEVWLKFLEVVLFPAQCPDDISVCAIDKVDGMGVSD